MHDLSSQWMFCSNAHEGFAVMGCVAKGKSRGRSEAGGKEPLSTLS